MSSPGEVTRPHLVNSQAVQLSSYQNSIVIIKVKRFPPFDKNNRAEWLWIHSQRWYIQGFMQQQVPCGWYVHVYDMCDKNDIGGSCVKMSAGLFYWNRKKELKFSVSPEPVTLPALKTSAPLPREINLPAAKGEKPNLLCLSTCRLLPVAAFCDGNEVNIHAEKPVRWWWMSHPVQFFIFYLSDVRAKSHITSGSNLCVTVSFESMIIKIIIIC